MRELSLNPLFISWEDFYTNYLSKPITIPVWLPIISIFLLLVIFVFRPQKKKPSIKQLETIEGENFGVQQVILDGKRFVNCTFDGSELVFNGLNAFALEGNTFETPPRISFQQHAGMTFQVIKTLYDSPDFNSYIELSLKNKLADDGK